MKIRIYYHHTDSGGVVYYANYLKFLEEARTEFLEARGILVKELADKGILFVVARQEIDYKFPSFYGDVLEVSCQLEEVSRVKIIFTNDIVNQDKKLVAKARTILVCVDSRLKPQVLSNEISEKLKNS